MRLVKYESLSGTYIPIKPKTADHSFDSYGPRANQVMAEIEIKIQTESMVKSRQDSGERAVAASPWIYLLGP
jgi:hypothetical protein